MSAAGLVSHAERDGDGATHRRRVVLLGASNLVRGISTAVELASRAWGRPLEVVAALGHGRSYGKESRIFGRVLPGIATCEMWDDLAGRESARTAAILTDVGNDILYGADPETIADWVDCCLARLTPCCEKMVVTRLPLASLRGLGPARFLFFRSLLFPNSRLDYRHGMRLAERLDESLVRIAARHGAGIVEPDAEWFGADPIHIRRPHWPKAWGKFLQPWSDAPIDVGGCGSLRRWLYLRTLRPHCRRLWGIEQRRRQPAGTLADGSTVAFY